MTYRERHPYNVKLVTAFMLGNKGKAYKREEVARATGVSVGAVKGILHKLHRSGELERHFVKERDGSMKTYYNWTRCQHLAGEQCVVREKDCKYIKACCLTCKDSDTCGDCCEVALLRRKAPEVPKETKAETPNEQAARIA